MARPVFFFKAVILVFVMVLTAMKTYSQDTHFSQFYASPVFLNPALAGSNHCARANINYRNQWLSYTSNYITYAASVDKYVNFLSGGVALLAYYDEAGDGVLIRKSVSATYSYHLKASRHTTVSAAISGGFYNQSLNTSKLVFADMILPDGSVNTSSTSEVFPERTNVIVPDFSAGVFIGHKQRFFGGLAFHHVNQPDISFYSGNVFEARLNMKITAHGGAFIPLNGRARKEDALYFSPNFLIHIQKDFHELNSGFYLEKYPFTLGGWYRVNLENSDAAIILVGFQQKKYNFGYSYDFSVSRLRKSGGSHEISLTILLKCLKKRQRIDAIKCPEF